MRILSLLLSLIALKIFSSAEVSSKQEEEKETVTLKLSDLGRELLYEVSSYLENPFTTLGSLKSNFFIDLFSKVYPVKRIFNDRFKITELVTKDVDDNEEELRYLFDLFSISNPLNFYDILRNEFENGVKLNVLLPNLMNYFARCNGNVINIEDINTIIKRKCFGYFFKGENPPFYKYTKNIFATKTSIKDLQEYILMNPEHLAHVHNYFQSLSSDRNIFNIIDWIRAAIASNMPDMFIYNSVYQLNKVIDTNSIWIVRTPRELNPVFYHKLDIIINTLFSGFDLEFFNALNLYRFGTIDSEIYDSRIEPVLNQPNLSQERKDLFRLCATFAVDDSGLFMEKKRTSSSLSKLSDEEFFWLNFGHGTFHK